MDNTDSLPISFTAEEKVAIQAHIAKYPDRKSAIMPALWIAQEKFGWLSPEVMRLVASTLDVPYAQVYGVATFYTMYFKEDKAPNLVEVCTCFSCGEMQGREMYAYLREAVEADEQGIGKEGKIWVRQAECLGACDTGPVAQVSNRRYVHKLTKERIDEIVQKLRNGEELPYERIPLTDQSIIDE